MHRFDLEGLSRTIGALPVKAKVAFALACAERLVPYGRHTAGSETGALARAARETARRSIACEVIAAGELEELASRLESSPDIDDDDIAACAFVLECLRTGDTQSAVRAAVRACDARERAAEKNMVFSVYTPEIESALLGDPALQAELANQTADLDALARDLLSALQVVERATVVT